MIWMEKMLGKHENPPKEVIPIQRLDAKSLLERMDSEKQVLIIFPKKDFDGT